MPNPVFEGMADALLGSLGESASAILTNLADEPPSSKTVAIIFNARHVEVDYRGVPFGDSKPVAWLKRTDFDRCEKPKYGDEMTIDEKDYMILEVKDDGLNFYQLTLGEK